MIHDSADRHVMTLVHLQQLTDILEPGARCVVRTAAVDDLVEDLHIIDHPQRYGRWYVRLNKIIKKNKTRMLTLAQG